MMRVLAHFCRLSDRTDNQSGNNEATKILIDGYTDGYNEV